MINDHDFIENWEIKDSRVRNMLIRILLKEISKTTNEITAENIEELANGPLWNQ